jgi:phosphatidate cytidylyltransferase
MSTFAWRALFFLTLGPLGLFLVYLGGWLFFVPVFLLVMLATFEYAHLMQKLGWQVTPWLLLPFVAGFLLDGQLPELNLFAILLVLSIFACMVYALWHYERRTSETTIADWWASAAGILLLGGIGSFVFRLRGIETLAVEWTILALVGTWMGDAGAYLVGRAIGRHKLAPRISPKKTVEGFVGGIVIGTLVTVALAWLLQVPLLPAVLLGLVVTAISPAGDLGISLLKREAGVKDSGRFLPGHGGALDRLDNLLWSIPFAYFLSFLL